MVIAMLVVLASLGPILSPVTGRRTWPWLGPEPEPEPEPCQWLALSQSLGT